MTKPSVQSKAKAVNTANKKNPGSVKESGVSLNKIHSMLSSYIESQEQFKAEIRAEIQQIKTEQIGLKSVINSQFMQLEDSILALDVPADMRELLAQEAIETIRDAVDPLISELSTSAIKINKGVQSTINALRENVDPVVEVMRDIAVEAEERNIEAKRQNEAMSDVVQRFDTVKAGIESTLEIIDASMNSMMTFKNEGVGTLIADVGKKYEHSIEQAKLAIVTLKDFISGSMQKKVEDLNKLFEKRYQGAISMISTHESAIQNEIHAIKREIISSTVEVKRQAENVSDAIKESRTQIQLTAHNEGLAMIKEMLNPLYQEITQLEEMVNEVKGFSDAAETVSENMRKFLPALGVTTKAVEELASVLVVTDTGSGS